MTSLITLRPATSSYFHGFGVYRLNLMPAITTFCGSSLRAGSSNICEYIVLFILSSEMSVRDRLVEDADAALIL